MLPLLIGLVGLLGYSLLKKKMYIQYFYISKPSIQVNMLGVLARLCHTLNRTTLVINCAYC
jgi:hypothetical protein